MNKMNKLLCCLAGVTVLGSLAALAEEAAPVATASTDLSLLSAYVWRGQVVNKEAVFQPSFTMGKNGFAINTWGNANLTDAVTEDAPEFSELDLTVSYSKSIGDVALSGGYIEYTFPNTVAKGTRELFASVGYNGLPIVPTLSVNYDIDEADGAYGNFALAYNKTLGSMATLGLSASIGAATAEYNSFYFGVDKNAVNDVNAGASLALAVTKSLTITPSVQYTALPDSKIKDGAAGLYKETDIVVGAVKCTYVF